MKVILCILDGFGIRPFDGANALRVAQNWRSFLEKYPWIPLEASSEYVGLPSGQIGNSEVGHMTMGCGQIFHQDLPRLTELFSSGKIWSFVPSGDEPCHVMGLLSSGGVHSHEDHFLSVVSYMTKERPVWVHPFLDGRDTAPQSAMSSLEKLMQISGVRIGTLMGRFYAMDRDQRWERTEKAYQAIMYGQGKSFENPLHCLQSFYAESTTDEFILPCVHADYKGVRPAESLWMVNFRADRVRQILSKLLLHPWSWCLGMSSYGLDMPSILKPYEVRESLGEIVSKAGLKQIRIAETEKYPHVTFFFNGGREEPFVGEDRLIISSPKVRTYDEKPEMAAYEITDHILKIIKNDTHDLIIVNYANADMVGHTGIPEAIEKAILSLDHCLKQLEEAALAHDWALVITADHGNAEFMFAEDGSPHTAHTCSPVPFMVIAKNSLTLEGNGLKDIKQMVLKILNLNS